MPAGRRLLPVRAPWAFRPAGFATRSVTAPIAALCLGICLPSAAQLATAALPAIATILIFCAVASAEAGRPSRAEAVRSAAILCCTMLACPAVVAAAAFVAGLGPEWTCVAVLLAGSPVSMGGGVVAARFGLPVRPVVWAATMSIGFVPATLPLFAAISGAHGLPEPRTLAAAAAGLAGLPLFAALLARRVAPSRMAAIRPDLRGIVVLALCVLACSAGGRTVAAMLRAGAWEGCAVALGVQGLIVVTGWLMGAIAALCRRSGPGLGTLAPQLALASATRNISIAWAATVAAGGLSPSAECAVSTAVSLTVLAPAAMSVVAARRRIRATYTKSR